MSNEAPRTDADGYRPATSALRCGYCTVGKIDPILEYSGYAHSEHRDCTGFECDHCGAEWDRDGDPRKGSHAATLAYEARRTADQAAGPETP